MTKTEIIRTLENLNEAIRQQYNATVRGIFGSMARGGDGQESDLDILVEFHEDANLLHLVGLSQFLEEQLQRSVDLVPIDAIREELEEEILREAIYL